MADVPASTCSEEDWAVLEFSVGAEENGYERQGAKRQPLLSKRVGAIRFLPSAYVSIMAK